MLEFLSIPGCCEYLTEFSSSIRINFKKGCSNLSNSSPVLQVLGLVELSFLKTDGYKISDSVPKAHWLSI